MNRLRYVIVGSVIGAVVGGVAGATVGRRAGVSVTPTADPDPEETYADVGVYAGGEVEDALGELHGLLPPARRDLMDALVHGIRALFLKIDLTPSTTPKETLNKSLYAHHCIRKVRRALNKVEAACEPRGRAAEHVEAIEGMQSAALQRQHGRGAGARVRGRSLE